MDAVASKTIEGLSGALVELRNEVVSAEVYTARTDEAGEALFSGLPAGHVTHSGTVRIRPGATSGESVFPMNRLVAVEWSAAETTIEDEYEIEAKATFETDVPAPRSSSSRRE